MTKSVLDTHSVAETVLYDGLPLLHFFLNSTLYAVSTTLLLILTATPAAYAITKLSVPGSALLTAFFMRQYLLTLPDDVLKAARIDGCSEWGILLRIIFPRGRAGDVYARAV